MVNHARYQYECFPPKKLYTRVFFSSSGVSKHSDFFASLPSRLLSISELSSASFVHGSSVSISCLIAENDSEIVIIVPEVSVPEVLSACICAWMF